MSFCLILLAAGDSKRFSSKTPKPFVKVGGKTLLELSLIKFGRIKQIKKTILVINKKHKKFVKNIKSTNLTKITGGNTRQKSTYNALKYIQKKRIKCSKVLIHDSARPNFSLRLIRRIIKASGKNTVIPKIPIHDALKELINKKNLLNLSRENFFSTQTPQSFNFNEILNLHYQNKSFYKDDDLSLLKSFKNVKFIEGEKNNFKITNEDDLLMLKNIINLKIRNGIGFDVHRLVPKKKLYLGGLKIPYHSGLKGHSDGDVIIHSVIDSILGAMRKNDIGTLFPDNKNKFKNIRSSKMLKPVLKLLNSNNYFINNLDINLICEQPKISKHRDKIINSLSNLLDLKKDLINLKGKTTEKLGLIGKEKAIACEVICSISKWRKLMF